MTCAFRRWSDDEQNMIECGRPATKLLHGPDPYGDVPLCDQDAQEFGGDDESMPITDLEETQQP